MATYPSYNLNEPFKINNSDLENVWGTIITRREKQ